MKSSMKVIEEERLFKEGLKSTLGSKYKLRNIKVVENS